MNDHITVFLNAQFEIEGKLTEMSLGLSGRYDNGRAWDLCWDESWVYKITDPDLFHDEFVRLCESEMIDARRGVA